MADDVIPKDEDVKLMKARGLGRGLNALFEDEETGFASDEHIEHAASEIGAKGARRDVIGIEQLRPGALQPRHVFDDAALAQLSESIKTHGVLQPLLVRKIDGDVPFEIIAGERRWRASQKAQLHEVPVIILELDDIKALEIALIENLQREDLNPIDEALGYQKLMQDYGHTQEKLGESLGKSRSHIANMVRLLNLPTPVQVMLADNSLSMGHARALITAKNPEELAKKVISQGLSVRATEKLANEVSDKTKKGKSSSQKTGKDADTVALEEELSNALGMKVSINSKNGKSGTLSIDFKSLDQLDEVLHRLSHYPGSRLTG